MDEFLSRRGQFLTFTDESDMIRAADELREHGFAVVEGEVTRYVVLVSPPDPPPDVESPLRRQFLFELARRHNGRLDSENPRKGTIPRS